ncbi:hypothetical protein [Archangium lansingense]|uniref:Uncharacterized protein n=1 Tax=Archangium lansingense TaxID=2995310 RepID=A0ABT3ZWQ4_9BACT|nr:hypothetical protein [Archangium lansinium]MCY1073827.1 hypothetical protein [Archangium lansinium]
MDKEDIPRSEVPPAPYHVLKRYRGIGGGVGRLYEVRNDKTGNAALVLMPGPKGELRPQEDWEVRLTSHVAPPYLALEVERAPVDGQPQQLAWMLDRWATALVRIEERPEAQAHLAAGAQKPPPPPETGHRSFVGTVAMAALLALGVTPGPSSTPEPISPTAPPALAVDKQMPPVQLLTDAVQAIALPMPQGPFKGQNRPPCKSKHEVVIRGGCWVEIASRPPCGDDAFEHEGKCYMPGYSAPRPPQALNP